MESSRRFDLSTMISKVISHGNPVLVGCDKNPAPSFVEKLATKVGARLVVPEEDLKVEEKRNLVNAETSNDHELDAHASAKHALKDYKTLFRRIDEVVEKEGKEHLRDQLKYLVIKEGMSITDAIDYLEEEEEPDREEEKVKVKTVRPEKEIEEKEKQIALLEQENEKLSDKIGELEDKNDRLQDRIEGMPVDQVVKEKERTIKNLGDRLAEKQDQVKELEEEIQDLKEFLGKSTDKVIAKKFKNLSKKEFANKEWMNVKEGDVLLVNDPNVANEEVIKRLQGEVKAVIHRRDLKVEHEGIPFIKAKNVHIDENEDFALVDEDSLEEAMQSRDVLENVVMEYKKKR